MASVNQSGGVVTPNRESNGALDSSCPVGLQLRIEERRRIGRELHDSTAQLLVALQLNVVCLKKRLGVDSDGHGLLLEIDQLLAELHREVRAVAAIAPAAPLRGRDLEAAIRDMAAHFTRSTGVKVAIMVHRRGARLSGATETALYRIAQEAVANAARHGRARHITITVGADRPGSVMAIEDDGVGIGPTSNAGTGLNSIRERVDEIGGLLSIQRLERGTRLSVSILRASANEFDQHGGSK